MQACFFDREIRKILLARLDNLHTEALAFPLERPVYDFPLRKSCEDRAATDGEVHETYFEVVEAVYVFELRGHAGHDGVETGVDQSGEEEYAGCFFLGCDEECADWVGKTDMAFFS